MTERHRCEKCDMVQCNCPPTRATLPRTGNKPNVGEQTCEKASGGVSGANSRQVGGTHWQKGEGCPSCGASIEHWDFVLMHKMPYMEASIFGYVLRWRDKGGLQDLEKAKHFLEKLIEHESK